MKFQITLRNGIFYSVRNTKQPKKADALFERFFVADQDMTYVIFLLIVVCKEV